MDATCRGLARVLGAWVPIVAVDRSGDARPARRIADVLPARIVARQTVDRNRDATEIMVTADLDAQIVARPAVDRQVPAAMILADVTGAGVAVVALGVGLATVGDRFEDADTVAAEVFRARVVV